MCANYAYIKITLLINLVLIFSCSPSIRHNKLFDKYIEKFKIEAKNRSLGHIVSDLRVRIHFAEGKIDYEGKCSPGKFKHITINEQFWNKLDTLQKEALIFHELGHCILGREHKNKTTENGECLSLMDGKENGFECSNNYYCPSWRKYYIDELFGSNATLNNCNKNEVEFIDTFEAKKILLNQSLYKINEKLAFLRELQISLNNSDNFQIDLFCTIDSSNKIGGLLGFNDILFQQRLNIEKIYIEKTRSNGKRNNHYYFNDSKFSEGQLRLTVRKYGTAIYFLLNKSLLHCMNTNASEIVSGDKDKIVLKNFIMRNPGNSPKSKIIIFEY